MGEQENVKAIQHIYANFGQGNIPAILNTLSSDVEWVEPKGGPPPMTGTYRGPAQVGEFFKKLGEAVNAERFEPREFIAQGEKVVALGSYRFRAKSTGTTYETDWAMVWTFRLGKVVRFQAYKDSAVEAAAFRHA